MYSISLNWKNFSVNLQKVNIYIKQNCSSNFDGLVCDEQNMQVIFKEEITEQDSDVVNTYWNTITAQTFYPTLEEIVAAKINEAIIFGNKVIIEATIENVALGITQAGKTKVISDYFRVLQRYLKEGSLYAAVAELDDLISQGVPAEYAPYATVERLTYCKNRILEFLNTP